MSTPAYDTVRLARANKRPTGLDYIHNLCADFFELHGDRRFADDGEDYFWWCFWLGLCGWAMVMALPDRRNGQAGAVLPNDDLPAL